MTSSPVIVSLPIADRRTSYRFYREALGFDAVGAPADDGVPEPLQLAVNDGTRIMLIPTGGFGWVIGHHDVAPRGTSECIVTLGADSPTHVDTVLKRARQAGAEIVAEPVQQPWGYSGVFADPDGHLWMITAA
jgi:predicted lactoylglutathione lyase